LPPSDKPPPPSTTFADVNALRGILGDAVDMAQLGALLLEANGSVNIAANTFFDRRDGAHAARPTSTALPSLPPRQPAHPLPPTGPLRPIPCRTVTSPLIDDGAGVFTPVTRSLFTTRQPSTSVASPPPTLLLARRVLLAVCHTGL
jgi:hypothetical protein